MNATLKCTDSDLKIYVFFPLFFFTLTLLKLIKENLVVLLNLNPRPVITAINHIALKNKFCITSSDERCHSFVYEY